MNLPPNMSDNDDGTLTIEIEASQLAAICARIAAALADKPEAEWDRFQAEWRAKEAAGAESVKIVETPEGLGARITEAFEAHVASFERADDPGAEYVEVTLLGGGTERFRIDGTEP